MSEIEELEAKLRAKKMEKAETERIKALEKKEQFRKDSNIDVYTSDDYCGMSDGKHSFYYGYEVTDCPVKSHTKEELCEAYDCEKREWCFTADVGGKEIMKLRKSQLWTDEEEPFFYLLSGIAHYLKSAHEKDTKND